MSMTEKTITTHGGHLKDYPNPVRVFDDTKKKREVSVSVTKFYGVGVHYYIALAEESNPIIVPNGTCLCWDDEKGRGKRKGSKISADTDTEIQEEIDRLFSENFSTKTHKLRYIDIDKKWCYGEGD